jgi:hypothetical protein
MGIRFYSWDVDLPVREVGIIVLGKSLVHQQYPSNPELEKNAHWKELVAAVESFASTGFTDQVETFLMKNRILIVLNGRILVDKKEAPMHIYAICELGCPEKAVREALNRVHAAFLLEYPKIRSSESLEIFKTFSQVIDDILGDLVLRPQDRLDRIL